MVNGLDYLVDENFELREAIPKRKKIRVYSGKKPKFDETKNLNNPKTQKIHNYRMEGKSKYERRYEWNYLINMM